MDETYDNSDADTRVKYDQMARDYLYEGLEAAYVHHAKMMKTMARAFYQIDKLQKSGRIA
jgi:hypothetical protein